MARGRMSANVRAVVFAVAVLLTAAGCTSPSPSPNPNQSRTLRLAFTSDMGAPDPAVYYASEGLNVTLSLYEGLVRYKANVSTGQIEPWLADRYSVSSDGLTYTFHLRPNVKFHDGTVMDSAAAKASFERLVKVNGGPAYMLAAVAKMQTPDPQTFVVTLSHPVNAFLDYMASPYGPKLYSPKVLAAHAGTDYAQTWLKTHDAGTGPYTISAFTPTAYELKKFPGYWGTAPTYDTVQISIIPSLTTQVLKLESGDLDMIMHGVTAPNLDRLQTEGFQLFTSRAINFTNVWVNPNTPPFSNAAVRIALGSAIDRARIVRQVYESYATLATTIFPKGMLPPGLGTYNPTYDPTKLKEAVASLPDKDKKVDIVYTNDDPAYQQLGALIQAALSAAGLNATSRAVTIDEAFSYPSTPSIRPNLLVFSANPDAWHPDTWARLFYYKAGGLSYFTPSNNAEADALIDRGVSETDHAKAVEDYAMAADLYAASGDWVPLADWDTTIVSRKGITGFEHDAAAVWSLRLQYLRPTP